MRIVLDTNVALSALLWRGTPYRVFETIRRQEHTQLYTSSVLLAELGEILARPLIARRLALIGRAAQDVLLDYADAIELVTPPSTPRVVAGDPDDDHVIAAAVAARADLLISGDARVLALGTYEAIRIVSPATARDLIAVS